MRLPPLNAVKAFECAARTGSFVAAAAELGVSPAAVSMQVRNLEKYLGKKLFIRSNNQISLSDAGQIMYSETAAALNGISALTQRIIDGDAQAPLVLSILPSLGERWLAPKLAEFVRLEPGVGIEIRLEDDPVDFARHSIKMRVTYGRQHYPAFRSTNLFQDEVTPLCAPDFLPLFERGDDGTHIPEERLIHVDWGEEFASNPNWSDWFGFRDIALQINIRKGIQVAAPSLAITLAAQGLGIALGQKSLAAAELTSGKLVAPSSRSLRLAQPYCAIVPHAEADNQHLTRLTDWLSHRTD